MLGALGPASGPDTRTSKRASRRHGGREWRGQRVRRAVRHSDYHQTPAAPAIPAASLGPADGRPSPRTLATFCFCSAPGGRTSPPASHNTRYPHATRVLSADSQCAVLAHPRAPRVSPSAGLLVEFRRVLPEIRRLCDGPERADGERCAAAAAATAAAAAAAALRVGRRQPVSGSSASLFPPASCAPSPIASGCSV